MTDRYRLYQTKDVDRQIRSPKFRFQYRHQEHDRHDLAGVQDTACRPTIVAEARVAGLRTEMFSIGARFSSRSMHTQPVTFSLRRIVRSVLLVIIQQRVGF